MKLRNMNLNTRQGLGIVQISNYTLNISREVFIYRGAASLDKLEDYLRNETKLQKLKDGVKEWVNTNITVRPKSFFQSIYRFNR